MDSEIIKDTEKTQAILMIKDQAIDLLAHLNNNESWLAAPALTDRALIIYTEAEKYLRIKMPMVPKFDTDYLGSIRSEKVEYVARIIALKSAMTSLISLITFLIGNPQARLLLEDEISSAREASQNGFQRCAAIMARVALEHSLINICRDHSIYLDKDKTGAQKYVDILYKSQLIDLPTKKELEAKLAVGNQAAHPGSPDPSGTTVEVFIGWVEKWILLKNGGASIDINE